MNHGTRYCAALLPLLLMVASGHAAAQGSRVIATGGATQIEGTAGGGIVPWAVLAGYGSTAEPGGAAFYTRVSVDDFDLRSTGLALAWNNRIELSYARQRLDVTPLDLDLEQDVFGAKLRVAGDLIYTRMPQLALGVQHKRHRDFDVPRALGAGDDTGTELYASATKLWLGAVFGRDLLLNGTLRWTDANQAGLLGFGADGQDRELVGEFSGALLLDRHWAVGVEWRQKPDNLGPREQDWSDAFLAWFPNKRVAMVLAHAELGDIAGLADQSGWYLSLQLSH